VSKADAAREAVRLSQELTVAAGRLSATSRYSRARGALALYSYRLLAKNDSSVVTTPDNKVIGMAQFAGTGRAHLYPIEFIRGTVVKRILDKKDTVPAGWLGVVPKTALTAGSQGNVGVVVSEVQPNSPAARCGLQPNDIIIALDDVEVKGTYDLSAVLAPSAAGRRLKLRAVRQMEPVEVEVELAARDCTAPSYSFYEPVGDSLEDQYRQIEKRLVDLTILSNSYANIPSLRENHDAFREIQIEIKQLEERKKFMLEQSEVLGANVRTPPLGEVFPGFTAIDLTGQPQLAQHFGTASGLFVGYVTPGSTADVGGLKAGDVIIGLVGRESMPPENVKRVLGRPMGPVTLRAIRNKQPVEIKLSYPAARRRRK
jgi:C-terminal processing protease CtpA/Prc